MRSAIIALQAAPTNVVRPEGRLGGPLIDSLQSTFTIPKSVAIKSRIHNPFSKLNLSSHYRLSSSSDPSLSLNLCAVVINNC